MRININANSDVTKAVKYSLQYAKELGFSKTKVSMVATAVSELTRNILDHAEKGEITFKEKKRKEKKGVEIIVKDTGIGIEDIELAMQDNYSSKGSLGIGLPGTKRLMDEFIINSTVNKGTEIVVVKWL